MGIQDGWKRCPRCGEQLAPVDDGALGCESCGARYYAHSAPTANALVEDGSGRVLLGRRGRPPDKGTWDIPGGFVHEAEHPEDALRRELREETGLDVEPVSFLGVWMDVYGAGEGAAATLNLVWTARVTGGDMAAADDVAELRWFAADELPAAEECAFDCVHRILSAWRQQQA
jgi:ADP-ribose pyrophosphatase YjhB (NUDIX family)